MRSSSLERSIEQSLCEAVRWNTGPREFHAKQLALTFVASEFLTKQFAGIVGSSQLHAKQFARMFVASEFHAKQFA